MANDPFIADPVFTTPDGTPTAPVSWTIQSAGNSNALNPGEHTTRAYDTPDKTNTPMNVPGWTVQSGVGSNTVTGA
jgi:hypothetical protein